MVCPKSGPTKSTIPCSFLSRVPAGCPSYFHCLHESQAFLKDITSLAFGQAKGPPLPSPFMPRLSALGVPCRDPCQRLAQPLGCRRSHVSLAYVGSETSHAYCGICSAGGCHCGCGDIDVGCSLLPGSVSQYLALVCGQLPTPTGELPWHPGGPCHVGSFSCGTWTRLLGGRLASGQQWPPHIGPLPAWWCLPASANSSSVRIRHPG